MLADVARYGANIEDCFKRKQSTGILKNLFVTEEEAEEEDDADADLDSTTDTIESDRRRRSKSEGNLKRMPSFNAAENRVKFTITPSDENFGVIPNSSCNRLHSLLQAHKNPAFEPDTDESMSQADASTSGAGKLSDVEEKACFLQPIPFQITVLHYEKMNMRLFLQQPRSRLRRSRLNHRPSKAAFWSPLTARRILCILRNSRRKKS